MSGASIGTIVGGIVGGVIGFFAGGNVALGAALGMAIGGAVGGALDPPKTPQLNGPRLNDLAVQTSTYGAFIPRNYGVIAQFGNIFWLQNDKITEVEIKPSGGKGGMGTPQANTTTYSYFATFAIGLCEGPIVGIKRIWIGAYLYYDASSNDIASIVVSNEVAKGFKLYLGTDTQLPDPSIQADRGVADTPAYRGLAYIVFNDLPLEKYNNSLLGAQVKVELVCSATFSHQLSNQAVAAATLYPNAIAVSGNYAYIVCSGNKLETYNIANPAAPYQLSSISTGVGSTPNDIAISGDNAYVSTFTFNTLQIYSLINPETPTLITSIAAGTNPRGIAAAGNYIAVVDDLNKLFIYSGSGLLLATFTTAGGQSNRKVYISGDYAHVVCTAINKFEIYDLSALALISSISTGAVSSPNDICADGNYAYIACGDGNLKIYDISNPAAPSLSGSVTLLPSTKRICIQGDYVYVSLYDVANTDIINVVDKTSPFLVDSISNINFSKSTDIAISGNYIYTANEDGPSGLAVYFFADNIISPDPVPLSSIVGAEVLKSNLLTSGDIDATELIDPVRGYRVSALGAVRGAIEPLRASWPFDVVQHGYQIKFKKRGSAPVATIPASVLDARAAGSKPGIRITNAREMDSIMAKKVTIKYLDNTREYDINEQYASRINTDAVNEISIEIPVVFNGQEAAQKAEVLLYLYWMERYDIKFVLPYTYANLEPGDVITVNGDNAIYELRLTALNTLPDGRIECRAKHSKAALYSPAALGEEGQSVGAVLKLAGPTTYELLDIPMLRDVDNTPGFPVAMTGYLPGWPGGILYRSEDGGQTFNNIQGITAPGAVMGYVITSLTAHGGTVLDKSSTLSVKLHQGTLSSITEAQMFAGQNWFAYGVDTRWEIIAAQKCVLQGDGSYILTDFMRGQNGTEWATGLHAAMDKIILLDTAKLAFIASQSAAIGVAKLYRGITAGKALASESNRSFIYNAVNLEPLSPCALTGDRHPTTNDWTLIWTRRSRFAGWRDLIDAVGEPNENYTIEIWNSGFTTLKRTLTATTPTVQYTSAMQVTDWGSNQVTIYIKIAQLSAIVGTGYYLQQSLTR